MAEHDRVRVDEAADVIHVSMRVVARDAAGKPEYVAGPQVIPEDGFVLGAGHTGIADLRLGIEKALFGRHECPRAVDIDRASFEHDFPAADDCGHYAHTERPGDPRRHGVVLPPVVLARPAVEPATA